jgi:hypothetical protein
MSDISCQLFNGFTDTIAFLEQAQKDGRPLTLITAPQASAWLGAGYVKALSDELHVLFPDTLDKLIYDCGTHIGDALGALRSGLKHIAVEKTPALPALQAYAAVHGATIIVSG